MVYSMTGYGKCSFQAQNKQITIETKSLNSKYLDIRTRLPYDLSSKDLEVRKLINDKLLRGKVDLSIEIKSDSSAGQTGIDTERFKNYVKSFEAIRQELGIDNIDIFSAVLKLPDMLTSTQEELNEELWSQIVEGVKAALEQLAQHRKTEGISLRSDMKACIHKIESSLNAIEPLDKERMANINQRLNSAIQKHVNKENKDESRFEQELIYYLERLDINEEKVRLKQHLDYFIETMDDSSNIQKGKQLSFISQEIGREINTLGAKAYSSEIQRLVVEMKNELEKIKEQTANTL